MPPCGCLGGWASPRGCWETCTGENCPGVEGYLNEREKVTSAMLRYLSHKRMQKRHSKGHCDTCHSKFTLGMDIYLGDVTLGDSKVTVIGRSP